ncbi:hypothetical protein OROGR_031691 [Orobanche gracilis]
MADTENPKLHRQIDINSTQPPLYRMSAELTANEMLKEHTIPFHFFRRLSQRKESTWIISVFVILHLIAFCATMIVNDCWRNSHAQCVFRQLGRFSFQPLSENPLLGPSAYGLDAMGALRLRYLTSDHQLWRAFTSPCLHAGVFHLIISLSSVIFVGVHLEQEFGPCISPAQFRIFSVFIKDGVITKDALIRIGVIYIVSALTGGLLAALFLQDRPSVSASGALFGLLGATFSGFFQNWKVYSEKTAAIVVLLIILMLNAILGLTPLVNNFSNIGGFISGLLVGFMLLFKPNAGKVYQNKEGIFDYDVKNSTKLKQMLDKPVSRIVCLVILSLLLVGGGLALVRGVNVNKYCDWCKYIDCVPFKWWSCSDKTIRCEYDDKLGALDFDLLE